MSKASPKQSQASVPDNDPIVAELKAAGASLVLALAAAQNGDWAAAEQGTIDAQERSTVILRELQLNFQSRPGLAGRPTMVSPRFETI
jgi:hypothetical protein